MVHVLQLYHTGMSVDWFDNLLEFLLHNRRVKRSRKQLGVSSGLFQMEYEM